MAEDSLDALLRRTVLIVAQLAETALHHSERLDRLDALIAQHDERMAALEAIHQGIQTTLARVETLLDRLPRQGENGRDA